MMLKNNLQIYNNIILILYQTKNTWQIIRLYYSQFFINNSKKNNTIKDKKAVKISDAP